MKRRLFVFDMDGTLLPGTTACLELARATETSAALKTLEEDFAAGRLDTRGFARSISALWGCLGAKVVRSAFARSPKLRNIRKVTRAVAAAGGKSCLISMSPDFFADHFRDYGFDYIYSSRFPRDGERLDPRRILVPEDKPRLVRRLCAAHSLDFRESVAFGDSMSDYPLFRRLRFTIAVNSDAALADLALASYRGDDLHGAYAAILKHL